MAHYVWINRDRLEKKSSRTLKVDGIDLQVQLSPYDSPTAIVGQYDNESGTVWISFQYADDEHAASKVSKIDDIEFLEGRHSGKLLKISIPVDKRNLAVIALQTRVLDALKKRTQTFRGLPTIGKELNQEVAEDVLSSEFNDLAAELCPN